MTNGNKLYDLIPPVKRCREYHLYDYKGNRYLDMFLDHGRALMGHKPGKTMLPMKNSLEKGLWAPYPSIYEHRLKKLLGSIFPGYRFFSLFSHEESAAAALASLPAKPQIWQPLGNQDEKEGEILRITPLLPGLQTVIIASQTDLAGDDILPPFILEGLIRNFHDYLSFSAVFDRKIWDNFDGFTQWERKGPSLFFRGSGKEYEETFSRALENRILLPPDREIPALIPSQLSGYEIKCIQKSFIPGADSP